MEKMTALVTAAEVSAAAAPCSRKVSADEAMWAALEQAVRTISTS
jgi:hypothetical protein